MRDELTALYWLQENNDNYSSMNWDEFAQIPIKICELVEAWPTLEELQKIWEDQVKDDLEAWLDKEKWTSSDPNKPTP